LWKGSKHSRSIQVQGEGVELEMRPALSCHVCLGRMKEDWTTDTHHTNSDSDFVTTVRENHIRLLNTCIHDLAVRPTHVLNTSMTYHSGSVC
jgi:hypothetical protein